MVQLFHTLLKELVGLKELIWDIFATWKLVEDRELSCSVDGTVEG